MDGWKLMNSQLNEWFYGYIYIYRERDHMENNCRIKTRLKGFEGKCLMRILIYTGKNDCKCGNNQTNWH